MAENTRGQNTDDRNSVRKGEERSDLASPDLGSKEQISINRGMVDMDPEPSIGTNRTTRGSGISTKKNVTGSDYDG